ncbi:MAG: cation:proton antiporter [Methanomassiliicoccales archaeon]|nr:MAG: cation:proton antiporter [Methanomassiliicoccales archaeon]
MDNNSILLFEIAAIMIAAGLAAILFSKFRAPVIIGYIFAGILLSNEVLSPIWSIEIETINFLANLGIILLMFSIGIEFNLKRLKEIGGFAILAGSIEVVIMIVVGYEVGRAMGWGDTQSVFLGAVLAISSTAIIFRTLSETGRMRKPYADAMIGILIIEDLAAVIILTMVSPLAAGKVPGLESFFAQIVAILAFLALSLVLGVAIVPKMIDRIGSSFDDEVMLLVSMGLCFGMAIFAFWLGLSVAIGAFIIGVIISESSQGERISKKVCSIKEMFMAIFFVSIGLLIDPFTVLANLPLVLIIAAIFIVGKTVAVSIACMVSNKDIRTSLTTGLGMVAMGEFSFVIAKVGVDTGAVSGSFYSVVIGAAIITMVAMPLVFKNSDALIDVLARRAPRNVIVFVKRIEGMRLELDKCLAVRADRRRQISYQLFWILIDFTLVFLIQIFVLAINDLTAPLRPIAEWMNIVPSLLASIVSVALIIPPVVDMLFRVRKIGYVAVQGILEGGRYSKDSGRFVLKMFVNLTTAVLGVILFLSVLPFAPIYEELPIIPVAGIVIGGIVAWLLWDANKATYAKMCTVLSEGLLNEPTDKK